MDIRDIFFIEDSSESDDEISFISSSNLKQTTTTTTTSVTTTTELLANNKLFSNGLTNGINGNHGPKFGVGSVMSGCSSATSTKTVEKPFVNYDEKNNPYLVGILNSPIDLDEIVQEQKNNRINKNNNNNINGIGKTTTTTTAKIIIDLDDNSMKPTYNVHNNNKSTTSKSHTLEKYNEQRKQILNVTSSLQQKKTSDSSSPKNNKNSSSNNNNNEDSEETSTETTPGLMDEFYINGINNLKNKNEKKCTDKERLDKEQAERERLRLDKEKSNLIKEERQKFEKEKAEKINKEKETKKLHDAKIKSAISMMSKTKENEEREKQAKQNAQEQAQLEKRKQLEKEQAKPELERQEKKEIIDQAANLEAQRIEKIKIEAIKVEAKRKELEKQKQKLESEKQNQIKLTKIENDRSRRLEKESSEKEVLDAAESSTNSTRTARKRVQSYVTEGLRSVTLNKLISCLDSENTIAKKLDAPIRNTICEQIEKISFDSSTTKQDYIKKVAGQYTLIVGGKIQTYLIPFLPQSFISTLSPSQITLPQQPMSITQSQLSLQQQQQQQPSTPIKPMASTISPILQSSTTPTSSNSSTTELDKEFSLLKFEDCVDAITSEKLVSELYNDYSKWAFQSSISPSLGELVKLLRKYRKLISLEYNQPIDNIVLILLSLITNENFSQLKQKYLQLYKEDLNNGLISKSKIDSKSNLNIKYFEPLNEYIQKKQNRSSLFKIEELDLIKNGVGGNGSSSNDEEINLNVKISKASNKLEKEFLNIFDNAGRLKKKQTKINFLNGSSSLTPHLPPTSTTATTSPNKSSNKVCYNCKKNGYKCPGGIPCGKCLNIGLLCDKSSNLDIEFKVINGSGSGNNSITGKKRKSLENENNGTTNANSISNYFEVNNNNNNNNISGNGGEQNKKPKVEAQWIEKDIANGVYTYPLRAVNECDDVPLTNSLVNFKWIEKSFCDRETSNVEEFLFGCDCAGDCYNNRDKCHCILEGGIHYDDNGCIISKGDNEIVECNAKCKCSHERCKNRAIQHGQQNSFPLELYKTRDKGWSVRTCVDIPKFTYVCEYVGEIISHEVAEERGERYDDQGLSYLYDLTALEGENCLAIDATYYGNVSRFINHSCLPNLKAYNFFFDQKIEITKPRIAFFSTRNIKEGEELHFDYRYILPPGVSNKKDIPGGIPCNCGNGNKCRKWLWVPQYQKHSSRR